MSYRLQPLGIYGTPVPGPPLQKLSQILRSERLVTLERVEEVPHLAVGHGHDEMPREADALGLDLRTLGEVQEQGGERDRDAEAAVHHVVQEAVPRVVILILIALHAEVAEQEAREGVAALDAAGVPPYVVREGLGPLVQPGQIARGFEVAIRDLARDQERGDGQPRPRPPDLIREG